MIEFKPGNGGHGPEAYDTETGQYVEVECSIEGQSFKGWEELRDLILNSDPSLKQEYDNNTAQKAAIEDYIKNELYGPLLEEAIKNKNAETTGQVFFNSPLDAAENAHKLFTPKFFDTYKDLSSGGDILINPNSGYRVNAIACCLQNLRYPKNKMNKISDSQYQVLMSNVNGSISNSSSGTIINQRNYLRNNPNGFPIWRGMGLSYADMAEKKKVVESYYDEKSPYISTLAHSGQGGYYGSVTYMSMSSNYADSYSSTWSSNPGVLIKGFVKNPASLKILECPLTDSHSYSRDCNRNIREINDFRARSSTFINNVRNQIQKYGKMSQTEEWEFINKLSTEIQDDPGLCGIIMGYDAIMGSSSQFDILNPGIVDVVEV